MTTTTNQTPEWAELLMLTPEEVSHILGVTTAQLRHWRNHHQGPAFYTLDSNTIRYPITAIHHHLTSPMQPPQVRG